MALISSDSTEKLKQEAPTDAVANSQTEQDLVCSKMLYNIHTFYYACTLGGSQKRGASQTRCSYHYPAVLSRI